MIIVEVTFKIDSSLTEKILKEKFLETAPIYKTTPGLITKNYISDLKTILQEVYIVLIICLTHKDGSMMKELNGSQIDIQNPS